MKNLKQFIVVFVFLGVTILSASAYCQDSKQETQEKAIEQVQSQAESGVVSPSETPKPQQSSDTDKTSASQPSGEKPTMASVKLVTSIVIKGNKSISTNTIISKMKTKIAGVFRDNVLSDDLKRLYLLGYFSDIKIDTEDYKDGKKIIIVVQERPIVEKITFTGLSVLNTTEEKLKNSLKTKEGQYLDYPKLADDIGTIRQMYEKIGYSKAKIEYKTEVNNQNSKVKISFNIVEGTRVRIKSITVEGNKAFKQGRILKLIKTRTAWFFNPGVLKEEVLKEDIERIKAFYHKNGYTDVEASYEVKADPQKPFLYITLKIQEGRRYLVGSVTIFGNKDISQKDILTKLKEAVPDKVFSLEAVKQDAANIQAFYFDKGYISAVAQETTSVDPRTYRVNITYNITENDITYVNKIKVRGNIKTRDVVIRRELRIKPGEKFDGDKLRRSKERLQNLGFFDDVSYDTNETASPDKKDLIVDVKEAKTGAFSFGGGYSTVEQFVGFVEIEQKNFDWSNWPYFTGAGQDLKFRASFGSITNGFDLSFTNPWTFDYPISTGFDAYNRKQKRDTDVGYGYAQNVVGGDLRLGKEFGEYIRGSAAYRLENINIKDVTSDASSDLKDEVGKNTVSSTEFGLSYDTRNNVFEPIKGDFVTASASVAGGPLGGDKDYWKFFGRASHYLPMINDSVIEFRGRLGLADKYDSTSKVPIYERYFAGGADTIRGYHERKIGPIDPQSSDPLGGDSMLIGNIEYTYPLYNFFRVAAFYDVGNVWEKMKDVGSGGFKNSFGLGFRIKTPMGPVRLDYGIPLNKEPGQTSRGNGRFHFSMSNTF